MQRIANPYYVFKRRVGSTPTPSAIVLTVLFALASCHPVFANPQIDFLKQYVTVTTNGKYCTKYSTWWGVYLPQANEIQLCESNIRNNFKTNLVNQRIYSALTHEAVHLAQDCKAGIGNIKLEPLNLVPNNKIPIKVKNRYQPEDYKTEAEAWLYQDTEKPFKLVELYCKKK